MSIYIYIYIYMIRPHPRAPPDAGAQTHPVHDGAPVHAADGRHGEDGVDGHFSYFKTA